MFKQKASEERRQKEYGKAVIVKVISGYTLLFLQPTQPNHRQFPNWGKIHFR